MSSVSKAARLVANLVRIAAGNPKRLSHVLGTALAASEEVVDKSCDLLGLPGVSVNDLLPSEGPPARIEMAMFPHTQASISLLEFMCLILLLKKANARKIFEFGTYKGVSITQLTLNLPPDSEIYTLDLPDESSATRFSISDPEDAVIAAESGKGALVPPELRPRIRFLRQDSATFDESPFAGKMDYVFVDGAHNDAYVRNDSEKGWKMLRPGGIIVWHDFRRMDPAVVKYLLQSSYNPKRINLTTLAFATKP